MKSLNSLDAYAVRRDMKKRIGFDEYCQTYGCSEDDLIYHIRRLFISDGDKIIKQMRKISSENKDELLRRAKKSQKQSRKLLEKASADGKAADTPEEGADTSTPPQWKFPLPRPLRWPSCMSRSIPSAIKSSSWNLSISA